jgi:hypothetical protein
MRPHDHQEFSVARSLVQYPVQSRAAATNAGDMVTMQRINQLRIVAGIKRTFGIDLAPLER